MAQRPITARSARILCGLLIAGYLCSPACAQVPSAQRSPPAAKTSVATPSAPPTIPASCHLDENNDYSGDIVKWGADNLQTSAADCCASCSATPPCNIWVWCGNPNGCGGPPLVYQSCWLKNYTTEYIFGRYKTGNPSIVWTGGALFDDAAYEAYVSEKAAARAAIQAKLDPIRDNTSLPLIFMDVAIDGQNAGRVEIVPFADASPRAAENLRVMFSGEKQNNATGMAFSLVNGTFYRIIVGFIDQLGPKPSGSIYGGTFLDDIGGLRLNHTTKGLLSAATMGPNTNAGDFSMVMAPFPHLNGNYVIFGQVVNAEGLEVMDKVNALAQGQPNNEILYSPRAVVSNVGEIRRGTIVDTKEYQDVIASEYARVAYNNKRDQAEVKQIFDTLWNNNTLPLAYLEVAINGTYAGRISMVLDPVNAPLATEAFLLMASGEKGRVPAGRPGAVAPGGIPRNYTLKGSYFYRIVKGYINQFGIPTDSPLGGYYVNDPAGLNISHSRPYLLSTANNLPANQNGANFLIMSGPGRQLDGKRAVFGQVVDGFQVVDAINALASQRELTDSKLVQIIDSGVLRRGTYIEQSPAYAIAVGTEKNRIAAGVPAPATGHHHKKRHFAFF